MDFVFSAVNTYENTSKKTTIQLVSLSCSLAAHGNVNIQLGTIKPNLEVKRKKATSTASGL
jgi:hypothetical protein